MRCRDTVGSGYPLRRMVTKQEIVDGIERTIATLTNDDAAQCRYVHDGNDDGVR